MLFCPVGANDSAYPLAGVILVLVADVASSFIPWPWKADEQEQEADEQGKAEVERAWRILSDASRPGVGNINQKSALEYLVSRGRDLEGLVMSPGAVSPVAGVAMYNWR